MKCYILGSLSREKEMEKLKNYLSNLSTCVIRCIDTDNDTPYDELISKCFDNIVWADVIIAFKNKDNELGLSSMYEVEFAKRMGKVILYAHIDNGEGTNNE